MSKLLFFGDFLAKTPSVIKLSSELKFLLESAHYNICNFEAPVEVDALGIKKSGPSIFQSKYSPSFLEENGFNVVTLANNHIMDYGEIGVNETISSFRLAHTFGVGNGKDAYGIECVDSQYGKIVFIGLTHKEFGVINDKSCGYGAAWVLSTEVRDMIISAKEKAKYVFILPHAGVEEIDAPLPEWQQVYRRYIDWGADGVIASHPHCPQGWEFYKNKPIFYSLGNFYFDALKGDENWYRSLAVEMDLNCDSVSIKVHNLKFDTEGHIDIDYSDETKEHTKYINSLIADEKTHIAYINKIADEKSKFIRYGLLRGLCGVSLRFKVKYIIRLIGCLILNNSDEMYLLNAFQCESHRWLIERYLRNNYETTRF